MHARVLSCTTIILEVETFSPDTRIGVSLSSIPLHLSLLSLSKSPFHSSGFHYMSFRNVEHNNPSTVLSHPSCYVHLRPLCPPSRLIYSSEASQLLNGSRGSKDIVDEGLVLVDGVSVVGRVAVDDGIRVLNDTVWLN